MKWKEKKARVAILTQNDFKPKTAIRDKEGHYIMIKGSIQQEDITIVNIYAPNIGAPKYIKQILTDIKGEIGNNTIIAGTLTSHLHQWIDNPGRKINKEIVLLSDTSDQMDLGIHRTFHPQMTKYTLQVHIEHFPG